MSKSSGNPAEDYSRGELAIAQGLFNNPLNDITCIRTVRPILNFFLFPESLERALSDDMFSSIFFIGPYFAIFPHLYIAHAFLLKMASKITFDFNILSERSLPENH